MRWIGHTVLHPVTVLGFVRASDLDDDESNAAPLREQRPHRPSGRVEVAGVDDDADAVAEVVGGQSLGEGVPALVERDRE